MDSEASTRVRTLLHVLLDDEAIPFTELPVLLEALESEDRAARIAAAWALCLLAEYRPAHAEHIYGRLAGHDTFAALLASNWLLKHHGEEWLDDRGVVDVADVRGNPLGRGSIRTTREERGPAGGPTVVDSDSSDDGAGGAATADLDDEADPADASSSPPSSGRATEARRRRDGQLRRPARDPANRPPRDDAVVQDGTLAVRTDSTNPESVRLLTRLTSDRYAWTYVGAGKLYGRMQEFLLRAYVPPEELSGPFHRSFDELIDTWQRVDDVDGVAPVIDWGTEPEPWVITEFASETVRSVERLEPQVAFETALEITSAIADLHANGITHGGLGPSTVFLDRSGDRLEPTIVDVGLGNVGGVLEEAESEWLPVREVECAPELRDRDYGSVDWMTDVYHLGIVLYTLFTGRSLDPVTGAGPSAIPDPTALESALPPAADRIVGKATGAHKVMRYESVDELGRDLLSAIEDNWGEPR